MDPTIVPTLIAAAIMLGDATIKETAKQSVAAAFAAVKNHLITKHDAAAEVAMLEKKPETGGPLIGEIETLSEDFDILPLVAALHTALEREAPAEYAAMIHVRGNVTDATLKTNAKGGGTGAGAIVVDQDVTGSTLSTKYTKG